MNTDEIMNLALEMAGLEEIPADSGIHVSGEGIKRVLIGINLVIAHHPPGGSTRIHFDDVVKTSTILLEVS